MEIWAMPESKHFSLSLISQTLILIFTDEDGDDDDNEDEDDNEADDDNDNDDDNDDDPHIIIFSDNG